MYIDFTLNVRGKSFPTTSFSRTPSIGADDMTHLYNLNGIYAWATCKCV